MFGRKQASLNNIEDLLQQIVNALTPVDTSGLDRVVRVGARITKQYKGITTSNKGAVMSTPQNPAQADIDADVASITGDFTQLGTVFTQISALLAAAAGNNTPVDTTALDALVAQGQSVVQQYTGLVPAPEPEPTPDDSGQ